MMHAEDGEMVCSSCGARQRKDTAKAEEFVSTEAQTEDDIIESSEEDQFEGKPTADDVICDECGHDEAWYTIKQTGAADEPPTRFFKCKECGNRWRGYS
jgi:DNA-directed RNA polymerase subunit M